MKGLRPMASTMNTSVGKLITDDMCQTFQRDGAVIVRGLLEPAWLQLIADNMPDFLSHAVSQKNPTRPATDDDPCIMSSLMHQHSPTFLDFLIHSGIAEAAGILMQSASARLFEDLLIYNRAGAEAKAQWHQDEPQWPVSGSQLSSVWFSLGAVTATTGAMRFVAGSHRGPLYVPKMPQSMLDKVAADTALWTGGPLPDIETQRDEHHIIVTELDPGDAVIFHPRIIHTAVGSAADSPRQTFTIRFLGDDIRWQPRQMVFHRWMLDCGLTEGDRFDHESFPLCWSQ
ncbi:hypothetical protein DVS77_04995 [Mycolicibacterium moriokaense]|nr:hypothetical protein DVS77_04995 [Mycolicibacterium moriokaense]